MFETTADFEWPRGAALKLHCAFHVGVERFYHPLQSWWTADLWENLKQAVSADQIKRFGDVNESDVHKAGRIWTWKSPNDGRGKAQQRQKLTTS